MDSRRPGPGRRRTTPARRSKMMVVTFLVLGGVLLAGARAASAQLTGGLFVEPPDALGQRRAHDFNPDPKIVEVVLAAYEWPVELKRGVTTLCMTFNGIVPGPLIEARVGDTLIVHFFNFLPEPSSIHWHGVEVPARMDGSHIAQLGVPAGGGYFKYTYKILRAQTAWYHPHFNTPKQVDRGMYGALVFRDPAEDRRLGLPATEHTIFLDEILLTVAGEHAPVWPADPAERAERQLNGRQGNRFEGNVLLINGKDFRTLDVKQGVPHRWRLINSSSARFARLSIPGQNLYRIGGDAGLIQAPVKKKPIDLVPWSLWPIHKISNPDPNLGILLAPGERAEIVFTPLAPVGYDMFLEWHDIARGLHSVFKAGQKLVVGHNHDDGSLPPVTMLRMRVKPGVNIPGEYVPPGLLRPVKPIPFTKTTPKLVLMFGHSLPDPSGDVTFFVQMKNGKPLPFDKVTPNDAYTVKPGGTRIWQVVNMTGGDHPFHTHGFFFQPIDVQYIDDENPHKNRTVTFPFVENKDVVVIPRRPGLKRGTSRTILRAVARFDDAGRQGQVDAYGKTPVPGVRSGGWLFHCHILEHAARGMMSFLQVKSR